MELPSDYIRMLMGFCAPKRPIQERRKMGDTRATIVPDVLFHTRAGGYGDVGIQAVAGCG